MASKKCPNCGTSGGKTAKFCKKCATPLVEDADSGAAGEPEVFSPEAIDNLVAEAAVTEDDLRDLPFAPEADTMPDAAAEPEKVTLAQVFRVEVKNGLAAGASAVVQDGAPVTIGTDVDADLALKGDDYASRRHATLRLQNGRLILRDEDSTNGTRLVVRGERELRDGDLLIAGQTILQISREE